MAAVQLVVFERGLIPGDAFNYLAAGERLNAGHSLYALSPGDRLVKLDPQTFAVPLVSPPPIAVVFRLLATLGDFGIYVWWALQVAALGIAIILLAGQRPLLTVGALLTLAVPLVYEIGVGNVNSFLLLGLVLTWRAYARGQDRVAGAVTAVTTALKLTPGIMAWWLLTQKRWNAIAAFTATGIAVAMVSVIGAGLDAHLQYVSILGDGSVSLSPLSLGGMLSYIGLPENLARLVPIIAIAAGFIGIWVFRERPGVAYSIGVVTMIAGAPAVSINWFVLLFALIAPLAWPVELVASARAQPANAAAPVGSASPVSSVSPRKWLGACGPPWRGSRRRS